MSPNTADRRLTTIINWLNAVGALQQNGKRYFLSATVPNRAELIEFSGVAEPMLLKSKDFREYQAVAERTRQAQETIQVLRNDAAVERADNAHRRLVNLVAERLRAAGSLPRFNPMIDLFAPVGDKSYIFEMKSITEANARSQVRRGVSQLYEYRYLQDLPESILVLVLEKPLPPSLSWMHRYLEDDRQIKLLWDGSGNLFASPETQKELNHLWGS